MSIEHRYPEFVHRIDILNVPGLNAVEQQRSDEDRKPKRPNKVLRQSQIVVHVLTVPEVLF